MSKCMRKMIIITIKLILISKHYILHPLRGRGRFYLQLRRTTRSRVTTRNNPYFQTPREWFRRIRQITLTTKRKQAIRLSSSTLTSKGSWISIIFVKNLSNRSSRLRKDFHQIRRAFLEILVSKVLLRTLLNASKWSHRELSRIKILIISSLLHRL